MNFQYENKKPALSANEALVVADNESDFDHWKKVASQVGVATVRSDSLTEIKTKHLSGLGPELLIIELHSGSDTAWQHLSDLAVYLDLTGAQAIVSTDMSNLDAAYAMLPTRSCHYLVSTNEAEMLLVMSVATRRGRMEHLHDNSRDGEFGALHRISDELADFARTLARMADSDGVEPVKALHDKPVGYLSEPANLVPFPNSPVLEQLTRDARPTALQIRSLIKLRRLRDNYFDKDLFADPAWDIMLDLYASDLERKRVSVSSLCIAAAVPPTTALRWIGSMTDAGILLREQDQSDARRVFIVLSDHVKEKLNSYLQEMIRRNLLVP
jgi:DNA-binding MarR family transcriptional regulator